MRKTDEYRPGDATGPNFCGEIKADCSELAELRKEVHMSDRELQSRAVELHNENVLLTQEADANAREVLRLRAELNDAETERDQLRIKNRNQEAALAEAVKVLRVVEANYPAPIVREFLASLPPSPPQPSQPKQPEYCSCTEPGRWRAEICTSCGQPSQPQEKVCGHDCRLRVRNGAADTCIVSDCKIRCRPSPSPERGGKEGEK